MSSPSIGKKMQSFEYKIDLIANQMDHDSFSKDAKAAQDLAGESEFYDIEEYEYLKFKKSLSKHDEETKLQREEMDDLYDLKVSDLHDILIKDPPKFKVMNLDEFYEKARKICENGFNLTEKECVFYFAKFLRQFNHSQNRSIFVKRLIQVTFERLNDEDMIRTGDVLKKLYVRGIFTKQQLRRGIDRIYMDAENIKDDVPDFCLTLSKILLSFVQDDILPKQVLLRVPAELREGMTLNPDFSEYFKDQLEVFERETEIKQSFEEVVASSEKDDAITRFSNLGHPDIVKPWFIIEVILSSFGKTNNEREAASKLLKDLSEAKEINYPMMSYCFDELLQNHENYTLDIPHFPDYFPMFIARSVYDGDLNSMYILHAEMFDHKDETQYQILKSAVSYLTLFPMETHIGKIWGSAISNIELCQKFDEIISDLATEAPCADLGERLKELDCPFFHHKFIKRLILSQVHQEGDEINFVRIRKFLESLVNTGILSYSQLEVGVKSAHQKAIKLSEENKYVRPNFEAMVAECLNQLHLAHE